MTVKLRLSSLSTPGRWDPGFHPNSLEGVRSLRDIQPEVPEIC